MKITHPPLFRGLVSSIHVSGEFCKHCSLPWWG